MKKDFRTTCTGILFGEVDLPKNMKSGVPQGIE